MESWNSELNTINGPKNQQLVLSPYVNKSLKIVFSLYKQGKFNSTIQNALNIYTRDSESSYG